MLCLFAHKIQISWGKNMDIYYSCCETCEYLYHCFGNDEGYKIINHDTSLYLHPDTCIDYYPEITCKG